MKVIRHDNEWWWGRTYTLITADGMEMRIAEPKSQ